MLQRNYETLSAAPPTVKKEIIKNTVPLLFTTIDANKTYSNVLSHCPWGPWGPLNPLLFIKIWLSVYFSGRPICDPLWAPYVRPMYLSDLPSRLDSRRTYIPPHTHSTITVLMPTWTSAHRLASQPRRSHPQIWRPHVAPYGTERPTWSLCENLKWFVYMFMICLLKIIIPIAYVSAREPRSPWICAYPWL